MRSRRHPMWGSWLPMWTRNHATLGMFAVVGALLAGCSGAVDGSAQPVASSDRHASGAPGTESSLPDDTDVSEDNLPKNGAPPVEDPLDASTLKDDLCSAMTDEQAQKFPGKFVGTEMDEGFCSWPYNKGSFRVGSVSGRLNPNNPHGLSKYYGEMNKEDSKSSPMDPVHGYPTVRFDLGLTPEDNCSIIVGLRDDLTYDVLVQLYEEHPSYGEPCQVARKFAGIVVDNLKEGQ